MFPEVLNYRDSGKFAVETGSDPTKVRREAVFGQGPTSPMLARRSQPCRGWPSRQTGELPYPVHTGDSMEPAVHDGGQFLVDTSRKPPLLTRWPCSGMAAVPA